MAGHTVSNASALPAAAHVVGNAFVNQYYNVLHQSPQVVHRFYTDASRVTRAEAGTDGAVDTVVSQSEIHQKVMALDYGDFRAEIMTVDSQDSLTGGVLVMVTGTLYSKTSGKRNFVQSFFLAPQEKGYFVLNDIFRYADDDPHTSKPELTSTSGLPEPSQVPLAEPEPSSPVDPEEHVMSTSSTPEVQASVKEVFEFHDQVAVTEADDDTEQPELAQMGTTPVIDEPPSPISAHAVSVLTIEETSEEMPKKSYASILRMKETIGSSVSSTIYNSPPKATALTPTADPPVPCASRLSMTITQDSLENGAATENEVLAVDGRSVYVKNLPISVSSAQLEEEFGKFGVVKQGGVNIKSQKQGVCYAFIEFEETASAQMAIEVSPISIGGRQVYIEEKRQMAPRAIGRSRVLGPARGDKAFRSDALRGRGTLTGRGLPSRGLGQDREREIANKGRGTGSVRSGNLGGGSNTSDPEILPAGNNASGVDGSRREYLWGNGNRGHRRGGGNQTPRNGVVPLGSPPVAAV